MRAELGVIHVISLKWAADRRQNLELQFSRTHWVPEIIDAVDGRELSEDPAKLEAVWESGKIARGIDMFETHAARFGSIGCALSHIRSFETMRDRGTPWTLVLEDDFEFCAPVPDALDVQDGADVVAMDTRVYRKGVGTMAMAYSQKAAQHILSCLPMRAVIDAWILGQCYGVINRVAVPHSPDRPLKIDTETYLGGPKRFVRDSGYIPDGESQPVGMGSYLR